MIKLEILKLFLEGLPIPGDIVQKVINGQILYKSGRKFPVDNKVTFAENVRVKSIRQEFSDKGDELYMEVNHSTNLGLVGVEKRFKIELTQFQTKISMTNINASIKR